MGRYLLIFDRSASAVLDMREFDDAKSALDARLEAEAVYSNNPSVEIVVLSAKSKAALRKTHLRYFERYGAIASGVLRQWASV